MSTFFSQPDPQQAVPGDLTGLRQNVIGQSGNYLNWLQGIAGGGSQSDLQRQGGNALLSLLNGPTPESRAMDTSFGALQAMLRGTPGQDVLGPLGAVFNRNLSDQLQATTASAPGRFGTGILEQQGRLRERSMQDFNLLSSQILEQGRARQIQAASTLGVLGSQAGGGEGRRGGLAATAVGLGQSQQALQLQAIMSLLGPLLGPTFGGPFTQDASMFQNFLGLLNAGSNFVGPGASRRPSNTGQPSNPLSTG